MQQYVYKAGEIRTSPWTDELFRLEGIDRTDDPSMADVFVCPIGLFDLDRASVPLQRFPYFRGNETKHVFFDISEILTVYHEPSLFFRTNLKTWMLAEDPTAIAFPWPVDDFGDCMEPPDGGFQYDVSFHGWLNYTTRIHATESCLMDARLKCDMARYPDFSGQYLGRDPETRGYLNPEGRRRMEGFKASMRASRICLCPESIAGDFPYRFFEAMSVGRIPFLIGTDQVFPFAEEIPYDEFTIQLPISRAGDAGPVAVEYLAGKSDQELLARGRIGRYYWEKYLDSRKWPQIMADVVRKKLT